MMLFFSDEILAKRIKKYREKANYTQEQLAEKIGLSRNQISNIERGINKLSFKTLRDLCDALDICPCELLCGAEHKTVLEDTIDLLRHMDTEQQIVMHQMILAYYEANAELKNNR